MSQDFKKIVPHGPHSPKPFPRPPANLDRRNRFPGPRRKPGHWRRPAPLTREERLKRKFFIRRRRRRLTRLQYLRLKRWQKRNHWRKLPEIPDSAEFAAYQDYAARRDGQKFLDSIRGYFRPPADFRTYFAAYQPIKPARKLMYARLKSVPSWYVQLLRGHPILPTATPPVSVSGDGTIFKKASASRIAKRWNRINKYVFKIKGPL